MPTSIISYENCISIWRKNSKLVKISLIQSEFLKKFSFTGGSAASAAASALTAAAQFPAGFNQGQLPGVFGVNFAQFRPQYSIPGQSTAFPGTAPPAKTSNEESK